MDNLNKQQVILIALLVAIVTSITTGIVTVSLTDDSSGNVSQVIYKVVQQTIDKVTPVDSPVKPIVETIKKTNPELSIAEIAQIGQKNLIKIYLNENSPERRLVSIGVLVGSKGVILSATPLEYLSRDMSLTAVTSNNTKIAVELGGGLEIPGFSTFLVKNSADISKLGESVTLNNFTSLSLGSNIIVVGIKDENAVVSTGIVTEITKIPSSDKITTDSLAITDIVLGTDYSGWLMFNTLGKLTGILYPSLDSKIARYIDASKVEELLGSAI